MFVTLLASAMLTQAWNGQQVMQGKFQKSEKLDKQLVVIRTYMPSKTMKERFHTIINQLHDREVVISVARHTESGIHFTNEKMERLYSMPETHLNNLLQTEAAANDELIAEFGDRVYLYDDDIMEAEFPQLVRFDRYV